MLYDGFTKCTDAAMTIETTDSQACEQLKALLDRAGVDREVIVARRYTGADVAATGVDELEGLVETAHLPSCLGRARRPPSPRQSVSCKNRLGALPKGERLAVCQPEFLEVPRYWVDTVWRTAKRLLELVQVILRDRFDEIGKPEPLKHRGSDVWPWRIAQKHRCVFPVKAERIDFLEGRYHY